MGKISDYANVLKSKLTDLFVIYQRNDGELETKNATLEQLGDAICGEQVHATLETSDQTIIGGINENKDTINELTTYIPVYGNTASGAIATFDTSLALPLQELQIAINAVQESGTPTPNSPKLISGFTGANITVKGTNLFDEVMEQGSLDNTTGENTPDSTRLRSKNYIAVAPNTNYGVYNNIGGAFYLYFYDANKTFIGRSTIGMTTGKTFTTDSKTAYIRFRTVADVTYNNDISINYPATDTAYHAYNANSTTTAITWQSEAGTVYGGSLDVTSGVLTVTWAAYPISAFNWRYASGNAFFYCLEADLPTPRKLLGEIISECYPVYSSPVSTSQIPSLADKQIYYPSSNSNIYIKDTDYTDTTTFVNALGTNLIVYELATPQTYQLTPTQISAIVGTNNVFTDTNGDTSVVYACSLKDYIDRQ